jgi:hypothetical protein
VSQRQELRYPGQRLKSHPPALDLLPAAALPVHQHDQIGDLQPLGLQDLDGFQLALCRADHVVEEHHPVPCVVLAFDPVPAAVPFVHEARVQKRHAELEGHHRGNGHRRHRHRRDAVEAQRGQQASVRGGDGFEQRWAGNDAPQVQVVG